ncbi:MAG: ABC transporter substrate-binding protein [Candidatus Aenigmatarchaeota archaeon]
MKNTFIVFLLVAIVFLSGCTSQTQKTQKVYHVGILSGMDFFATTSDGFKEKMTELGYVEGKDIIYDVQKTEFDMIAYKKILQKFVADKVDLIFVFPTEASQEAKTATQGTGIPVVFANANIEDTGLVNSVREPGGNITGVRWPGPDLALQRFEIMHELVPQVKRMLIPYQRGYPIVPSELESIRPEAATAGITLLEIPADNATELEGELQIIDKTVNNDTDVILIIPEPLLVSPENFAVLGKFAYGHKIPIGGTLMKVGNYESLFGLTPQNIAVGRLAAPLADKILRGMPAGTIPVVSAEGFFQINYKLAQTLNLNVSEGLLRRANEIIR